MSGLEVDFAAACAGGRCRACAAQRLEPVLDLGPMPASDALRTREMLGGAEPRHPLRAAFCPGCGLLQLLSAPPPELLFGERYLYFSSFSPELLAHARSNALEMIDRARLGRKSLVVEIAANDGYLLRNFVERGIPALGIEPAPAQAEAARRAGIPVLQEFFGAELAERLAAEGRRADVLFASNVLAHVPDTRGFTAGIARLLAPGGTAVIEVPYVRDLVEQCAFDTIYHEHQCYFSVTALAALFEAHGLVLQDLRRIPIHGGSLRLYLGRGGEPGRAVRELLAEERRMGLERLGYYAGFADRVEGLCAALRALLERLKAAGNRIAAYGAAAKGTILLNKAGIGPRLLDFVADRNTYKHGRFMPGVDLEIVPAEALAERRPDAVLLLAWNFREEILAQQAAYLESGGRFIVPIPWPEVVEGCAAGRPGRKDA